MTEIKKLNMEEAMACANSLDLTKVDREAMHYAIFLSSVIWGGYIDGRLACIWGLIPPTILSQQAYLWLDTTDVVNGHEFVLVRHSQLVVEEMLKEYPSIVGHAIVDNHKAIRWLKWLGAKFGEPQGQGLPFRISTHG